MFLLISLNLRMLAPAYFCLLQNVTRLYSSILFILFDYYISSKQDFPIYTRPGGRHGN